jgi:NADH:ubiquinone oxidoreductase subunit 6 (subunit J)
MILESKAINLSKNVIKYVPVGYFFVIFLLIPIINIITTEFNSIYLNSFYFNNYQNWYDLINSVTDIEVFGKILYSSYILHFLISGFILLLVLINVVYLTNTFNKLNRLEQSIFKQLSRNSKFFS